MGDMEAAGTRLLDFSQPFDVELLDQVVTVFYDSSHPQRSMANKVLMALQDNPDAWSRADAILEKAKNTHTKFFGLQLLEDAIKYRWKIVPKQHREGVKRFVVEKIISLSSDEATANREKVFLGKLNLTLVQILKHEWPHNWPSFISDLVNSSKTSEVLCENNMEILKLLSEEVFDFSKDQMTTQKIKTLKESLNNEFTQIYQLCEFILDKSQRPSLLTVTLRTLLRFLSWIPLGFIFETQLISTLLNKFLPVTMFASDTISCLTEIAALTDVGDRYDQVFYSMYVTFISHLSQAIPPETNVAKAFEAGSDADEVYIQRLSLFLTTFFKNHLNVLEARIGSHLDENEKAALLGLTYIVKISEVDNDQIFKICLEYWHYFSHDLYQSDKSVGSSSVLFLGSSVSKRSRKSTFQPILSQVRVVMISKMAKPEEVLIVEDENGEIVRETTKDTEALALYKTMRETLVYLTHLDYEDTENIMLEKLALQCDGSEWSWNNVNTLCWAIGSISGAMQEDDEKRFLVTVIKDLLGLCEMKRGKDNKAVIASNIMYVVGQYPRFLRAHWKFLKTVVNKLFEFMHELHPGVQDMACDTFLKISQKCREKFVTVQSQESQPFIEELLQTLPSIVSDLEPYQVHTFYEAVGCMVRAETNAGKREAMLMKLMALPNGAWKGIMSGVSHDLSSLMNPDTIKDVIKILKTNVSVCKAVGPGFAPQLGTIYMDVLNVYKAYSEHISAAVAAQGELATRMSLIRSMRSAKKEILRLIEVFVQKSEDRMLVRQNFLPPMLDPVLGDYQRNIAQARDPEVLSLFAVIINKLRQDMAADVPKVLEAIFECTLQMITANFQDFPEHRINFFKLLKAVNDHCFSSLFAIPPEHQKLVVDSVVWAFKHTERNIADTGLEILHALLINVQQSPQVAQGFYQSFFLSLLQDIFSVLTDRLHKSAFKMHATILKHMFNLVEAGQVTTPLWESLGSQQPPGQTNQQFLREYVSRLLSTAFPNLSQQQIHAFVAGVFDINKDLLSFKAHLRDFLIQLKEFSGEDNAELFREESTAASQLKTEQAMAAKLAVPGLVNPHERPDDMADL